MAQQRFEESVKLAVQWKIISVSEEGKTQFTKSYRDFIRSTAQGEPANKVLWIKNLLMKQGGLKETLAESWAGTQLYLQMTGVSPDKNEMALIATLVDNMLGETHG